MNGLDFAFDELRLQPAYPDRAYLLLDIVSNMRIEVGDRVLFDQLDFPIVELAMALAQWTVPGSETDRSFSFTSAEAEESPLIEFAPHADGWIVWSPWQEQPPSGPVSSTDLDSAVERFITRVQRATRSELGFDLSLNFAESSLRSGSPLDWWRRIDNGT